MLKYVLREMKSSKKTGSSGHAEILEKGGLQLVLRIYGLLLSVVDSAEVMDLCGLLVSGEVP